MTQPAPTIDMSGQRIVISGGSSGLGAACVQYFAGLGATVFFFGLEAEEGEALAARTGANFTYLDVRDAKSVDAYIADIARNAPLTLAINSAGISHKAGLMADLPDTVLAEVLDTNVRGVWYAMRAQINAMQLHGKGHIINIGSVLASKAAGWMAAYGMSKHAVIGMTRAAAADYVDAGLRINAVSPGPIRTPMFDRAMADIARHPERFAGGLPPEGPADPVDVAGLIARLAFGADIPWTGCNFILDPSSETGWQLDLPVDVERAVQPAE